MIAMGGKRKKRMRNVRDTCTASFNYRISNNMLPPARINMPQLTV